MSVHKVLDISTIIKKQYSQDEFDEALKYFIKKIFNVNNQYMKRERNPHNYKYTEEVTLIAPKLFEDLQSAIDTAYFLQ